MEGLLSCPRRAISEACFGPLLAFSIFFCPPPRTRLSPLTPCRSLQDDEMRAMRVQDLSDDGLMFLWVTGRWESLYI